MVSGIDSQHRSKFPQIRLRRQPPLHLFQKRLQPLGGFRADAFDFCELLGGGGFEFVDGAEVLKQGLSFCGSEAGEVVEDGFFEPLAAERGVEAVGEMVGFIPNLLEEPEGGIVMGQVEGLATVAEDDGFVALGQSDEGRRLQFLGEECFERGGDLSGSAIDDDQVGKGLLFVAEPTVAAADDFFHRPEVVVAGEGLDLKAAVVFAVGARVGKGHHGGDAEAAGDVGDVEAFHPHGFLGECEFVLEAFEHLPAGDRSEEVALEFTGAG